MKLHAVRQPNLTIAWNEVHSQFRTVQFCVWIRIVVPQGEFRMTFDISLDCSDFAPVLTLKERLIIRPDKNEVSATSLRRPKGLAHSLHEIPQRLGCIGSDSSHLHGDVAVYDEVRRVLTIAQMAYGMAPAPEPIGNRHFILVHGY